jgi:hypothetical protein
MAARFVAVVTLGALAALPSVSARVNATGAIEVFMISTCEECTKDKNSIFCTSADSDGNFVANGTMTVSIADKKRILNSVTDGERFCWSGTFGKLTNDVGNFGDTDILGSVNVTAQLACSKKNLFYRQCVIPAEMAIVLIAIASVLCVCSTTCVCFYCGCCKCCNLPGDDANCGMCNRWCPWMPCATKAKKEEEQPEWMSNPATEEQHMASLTGKNNKLNSVEAKPRSLADKKPTSMADLKKPGGAAGATKSPTGTPKAPVSIAAAKKATAASAAAAVEKAPLSGDNAV